MLGATTLLLLIGLLGAADIAYFHSWRGRLVVRPECRREAWIHVVRGVVYAAQFAVVPNVKLQGGWYLGLVGLFIVDVGVAVADVLEEPRSRAAQGGLSGGEYLMHIALSVLVGAFLATLWGATAAWREGPTALSLHGEVPVGLRVVAAMMALGSLGVSLLEAAVLVDGRLGRLPPLHVRVRLQARVERVWAVTQDHRIHPEWDHRFGRIEMLHARAAPHVAPCGVPDPRIHTGTRMRYERRLLGVILIRGYGRYRLHRPLRQSTFQFWSADPRSLIRRGVGLWLYRALPGGGTELSTSYTYDVRWGPIGRVIDRWLFRPLFQRFTEASFRRLARDWFGVRRPRVLGRERGRPLRFEEAATPLPTEPPRLPR